MTYINREMLARWVEGCLPNENLEDFDIDAIVDDIVSIDPDIIGEHDTRYDGITGPQIPTPVDTVAYWIGARLEETVDEDRFWKIVACHDLTEKSWSDPFDSGELGQP